MRVNLPKRPILSTRKPIFFADGDRRSCVSRRSRVSHRGERSVDVIIRSCRAAPRVRSVNRARIDPARRSSSTYLVDDRLELSIELFDSQLGVVQQSKRSWSFVGVHRDTSPTRSASVIGAFVSASRSKENPGRLHADPGHVRPPYAAGSFLKTRNAATFRQTAPEYSGYFASVQTRAGGGTSAGAKGGIPSKEAANGIASPRVISRRPLSDYDAPFDLALALGSPNAAPKS